MELKIKAYMQKLEEEMEEVMEAPITEHRLKIISCLVKAWHDVDSRIGHDEKPMKG